MQLAVRCDGATDEQRRLGKMAAIRVLMASNVTILAAWEATVLWRAWEGDGGADEDMPDAEVCMMVRLLEQAEQAANSAMSISPGGPRATLDWVVS